MKLALCVFKYFPYGGLQRNFLAITQELIKRGHQVTVYTGSWEGEKIEGIDIEFIPQRGFTNDARNRHFYRQLSNRLSETPVDIVVGFNKMPGLDVYYCADTCFATKAYEQKNLLYRLTPRSRHSLSYEHAVFDVDSKTEVLLLSANEGLAYQKYYGTPQKRLHLMPPGISNTRVRHSQSDMLGKTVREKLGVTDDETLIAFLGSDYKRKGLDRLLKSVGALTADQKEKTKVLVIGRDKRMPDYERLADSLSIRKNIYFVGQRDDVPELLFACDYLAHPAYTENTGNVLLEAVVAGLPVICTENCGYAFYISDNQLGKVVPEPFNQDVMNKLLAALLAGSEDIQERCIKFARTADIYSRPLRISEMIEKIGERLCR